MNVMFRLNNRQGGDASKTAIQEFKLSNFFECYRPFFKQTLPYESVSLAIRIALFDELYKVGKDETGNRTLASIGSGFLAGTVAQIVTQPFFLRNLQSQNCISKPQISVFDRFGWVALRGGLLGVCHLST